MRDQRGISESVQWAILSLAIMTALFGMTEAALVLHGRSVAVAAALAGSTAQAALRASPDAGMKTALERASAGGLVSVDVAVSNSPGRVTVRVDAGVPTLVGWVSPRVWAESTRPLEGS